MALPSAFCAVTCGWVFSSQACNCDQIQRDIRAPCLAFGLKLASRVCPTAHMLHTGLLTQSVITRVIIGHQVAAIAFEQARRNLLRPVGRVVKQDDNGLIRRPAGFYPHPGLAGRLSTRFFHHQDPRFVTVDDATFQQSIPHQVEQGLQMFAALDHPARQGLAWNIDAVAAQHFFEQCRGRLSTYLVVSNIANTLGLVMLFSINYACLSAVTGAVSQSRQSRGFASARFRAAS